MKPLIEKTIEYNRPLVLVFVDFQKAFEKTELNGIVKALSQCGVDHIYTCLIYDIYKKSTASAQLHEKINEFSLDRSVRQKDTISLKPFIAVLEYAFKNLNWCNTRINIEAKMLSNLRFADDIVPIADDLHKAEIMLNELAQVTKEEGLQLKKVKQNS